MRLTILSCYYNFNNNVWMEDNTRYCAKQWRKAGAHVVFVEIALHGTDFVFHPSIDEGADDTRNIFHTLLQYHVHDVMWYKDMALNTALPHVPSTSSYVAWFDNDVFFAPPTTEHVLPDTWWVDAIDTVFLQNKAVLMVQPFAKVALSTETVRNALLGRSEAEPGSTRITPSDAIRKCEKMARVRPSVMADPKGAVGCVWVARTHTIAACGFFQHSYLGGGEALMLNVLQGSTESRDLRVVDNPLQRYYFMPRGPFGRNLMRYQKKWQAHTAFPARFAYLPCTLVHLHHGELEKRTTHVDRFQLLATRQFHATRHVCANPEVAGVLMWSQLFRATGINQEMLRSLERSQTVRDKVLLRIARTQRCLQTMREQMTTLQSDEGQQTRGEHKSHQHVQNVLQQCLQAFDSALTQ